MRILIIEPDRYMCRAIVAILELAGHEAICAHDDRAGLQFADEWMPAFVFCDTKLPYLNGFEVLRRLRQTYSEAALPVVLMSAYFSSEDMVNGLALGANGYLIKPFTDAELLRKLETAVH